MQAVGARMLVINQKIKSVESNTVSLVTSILNLSNRYLAVMC